MHTKSRGRLRVNAMPDFLFCYSAIPKMYENASGGRATPDLTGELDRSQTGEGGRERKGIRKGNKVS